MNQLEPLEIQSAQGAYGVRFEREIVDACAAIENVGGSVVVVDETVARLHGHRLIGLTAGRPTFVSPSTEETKSLVGVGRFIEWLIDHRANKSTSIVAIGGGCIQDLVSFTSHIYYRGTPWYFLPTTVLSQADSCIGAKSGINVLPYKNQLGALHAPRGIVVCEEFIETLERSEVESGLGEILKLSVTSTRSFLDQMERTLDASDLGGGRLLELTRSSLLAKQEIIEEDEAETDLRRILNYGHSFGHALESISGHSIPHGIAVLWGMDVINWLGVRWGVTDAETAARLRRITEKHFEIELPANLTATQLVDLLARDKKAHDGHIAFAMLQSEGSFRIVDTRLDESLINDVHEYLGSAGAFGRG